MTRIDEAFTCERRKGALVLVAYLTAGHPCADETAHLVAAAVDGGADVIELGVPFSDPIGDGPVIQASSQAALAAGMTVGRALGVVAGIRHAGITTPIALMGYCNPFLQYGINGLVRDAAAAGVDAFVVPDLPPHEADAWLEPCRAAGLDMVFFAAPDSRPERLAYTAGRGSGFLYCLSRDGVTGAQKTLDPRLLDHLGRLRQLTTLPLAVGFGISQAHHVRALRQHADAVIVGSAIVQRVAQAESRPERCSAVRDLVAELKAACR